MCGNAATVDAKLFNHFHAISHFSTLNKAHLYITITGSCQTMIHISWLWRHTAIVYLLIPNFLWKAFPSPLVACYRINPRQRLRLKTCFTQMKGAFAVVPCWCLCVALGWRSPLRSLPLLLSISNKANIILFKEWKNRTVHKSICRRRLFQTRKPLLTWCVPFLGPPPCGSHSVWPRTPLWWAVSWWRVEPSAHLSSLHRKKHFLKYISDQHNINS